MSDFDGPYDRYARELEKARVSSSPITALETEFQKQLLKTIDEVFDRCFKESDAVPSTLDRLTKIYKPRSISNVDKEM